jgi:hypothetical protein
MEINAHPQEDVICHIQCNSPPFRSGRNSRLLLPIHLIILPRKMERPSPRGSQATPDKAGPSLSNMLLYESDGEVRAVQGHIPGLPGSFNIIHADSRHPVGAD